MDSGFPVDVVDRTDVRTITTVWMGVTSLREAYRARRLTLEDRTDLERAMQAWPGPSVVVRDEVRVGGHTPAAAAA